jgi:outer membrane lipoprotein-sorting protein
MKHLIAALALMLAALPLRAEPIPLTVLSDYLEGLGSATATFTQVSADGAISTGTLYIRRPGRARFEYDGDSGLVIAGGGQVAIFDPISNVPPEQFPLRRTPLNLILARDVDLGGAAQVVAHAGTPAQTSVLTQDPRNPELGTLELIFTGDPVELRQWVITDEAGSQTTVILGPLERSESLPNGLFNIPQEMDRRQN